MGFAPMEHPRIAIAVYVENGGFGADFGVPIGALLMEKYINGKLSPDNEVRAREFENRSIYYSTESR
jgi:penicillin-binding protein 2